MAMDGAGTVKRNGKLLIKIIMIALVAVVLVAAVETIVAGIEIDDTYEQLFEEELKATAEHLDDEFERLYEGDWTLDALADMQKALSAATGEKGVSLSGMLRCAQIESFLGQAEMQKNLK